MAAGTPVVVTDTGGLGEVVHHGKNGLKAFPNNPDSLADNILSVLTYPEQAAAMGAQARRDLETEYNWGKIAAQTIEVYQEVLGEYKQSDWHRQVVRAGRELPGAHWIRPVPAAALRSGRYTPTGAEPGPSRPAFNGQRGGYQ